MYIYHFSDPIFILPYSSEYLTALEIKLNRIIRRAVLPIYIFSSEILLFIITATLKIRKYLSQSKGLLMPVRSFVARKHLLKPLFPVSMMLKML